MNEKNLKMTTAPLLQGHRPALDRIAELEDRARADQNHFSERCADLSERLSRIENELIYGHGAAGVGQAAMAPAGAYPSNDGNTSPAMELILGGFRALNERLEAVLLETSKPGTLLRGPGLTGGDPVPCEPLKPATSRRSHKVPAGQRRRRG